IVFSAGDLVTPPTTPPLIIPTVAREVPRWNTNDIVPGSVGLFGPGTTEPTISFTFDKVAPILINDLGPAFVDEASAFLVFVWGSFDGTTNAPIVYPIGTSIYDLENQLVIQ